MWYSYVLKDPQSSILVFFYIPTIDSNGVFSMTIISIIISSIVIMMLKSLSYWAGCQQVS